MTRLNRFALVVLLLTGRLLKAQMIVSDPGLTSVASQELERLAQLNFELNTANRSLDLLVGYVGSTRAAVGRVDDLSTFVTNVGRLGAPKYRTDTAAAGVRTQEAMQHSSNPYRQKVGLTVRVDGKQVRRDQRIYEDQLRFEGSLGMARELLEANRAHQHTLLGRLSTANDHFEQAKNVASLWTASVEMQRLQALMTGADALGGNMSRDIELARLERDVAQEDKQRRWRETDRIVARMDNERAVESRRRLLQMRAQVLRSVPAKKSRLGASAPWVREGGTP